ncbi:MAG: hypothetical protein RR828_01615, partial [Oscillospiraceae bacterium]
MGESSGRWRYLKAFPSGEGAQCAHWADEGPPQRPRCGRQPRLHYIRRHFAMNLKPFAQELRKNATKEERHLW